MIRAIANILFGLFIFAGVVAMATYCRIADPNNRALEYLMIAQVCLFGSLGICIASDGWKDLKSAWVISKEKRRNV